MPVTFKLAASILLLIVVAVPVNAAEWRYQKTIFGDGNHANGYEDDRELLSTARGIATRVPSAIGTVTCLLNRDSGGSLKPVVQAGSGALVSLGNHAKTSVLITSNHLFFDPKTGMESKECYFRRAVAGDEWVALPKFNRIQGFERLANINVTNDVAFVIMPETDIARHDVLSHAYIPEYSLQKLYEAGMKIEFIAFSKKHRNLGISRTHCKIVRKRPNDLYYDHKGIYLHTCDSEVGSSGGALVATFNGKSILLGVHHGIKIDKSVYLNDPSKYPFSPNNHAEGLVFSAKYNAGVALNFHQNSLLTELYQRTRQKVLSARAE